MKPNTNKFPCTEVSPFWGDLEGYLDHLGSSSWITDQYGYPIQYLHYLPFGETWVDQRASSWNSRYTFSGKEKDEETGYSYFGARYYNSDLSIWLSVDPLADKYPSLSPYNYCLNNPIRLVDPDGRDVKPIGEEALKMIKNTLPKRDQRYVQLNNEGLIDRDKMNSHKSKSENYNSLKKMVNSDQLVTVSLAEEFSYMDNNGNMKTHEMSYEAFNSISFDPNGNTMNGTSTGESGNLGVTLMPSDGKSLTNSPDDAIHIVINKKASSSARAETYSHEANGHALMYIQTGDRKKSAHQPNGMTETNIPLRNAIIRSKKETIKNMR